MTLSLGGQMAEFQSTLLVNAHDSYLQTITYSNALSHRPPPEQAD